MAARLPPRWDRRLRELGKVAINYRGARATGLRALWFGILGRRFDLLVTPYGKGMMIVDTADQEIGRAVFISGEYERHYMQAALDYLRGAGHPVGPVFVDVGANIGTSTVDALLHFGFEEAVCFEPDSRNLRLLRLNLALNELDGRATVQHLALSDADGEAAIVRVPGNFGESYLVDGAAAGEAATEPEPVARRRLDALVEEGVVDPARVGLLWVDAQGHDPYVLAGAGSLLAAGVAVVAEYWPQGLERSGGLELFESVVRERCATVVDLRRLGEGAGDGAVLAAAEVDRLRGRYRGGEFTDLLLLAAPAG